VRFIKLLYGLKIDQMMERLPANKSTIVTDELDEESRCSGTGTARTESIEKKRRMKTGGEESKECTVEQLVEYQWPLGKGGESVMILEHILEYLGMKSFRKNYPHLKKRIVKAEEMAYLREKGIVKKSMCNLGLTVVNRSEILDIMYWDFKEKYEEYFRFVRARQVKEIATKQEAVLAATNEKKYKLDYRNKAIRSAAAWNSTLNRSRRDQRRCSFDLQNFIVHYPKNRLAKTLPKEHTKLGPYPLAIIPGKHADF
jgi:hypothetical protein